MKLVQQRYGVKGRTKSTVLAGLEDLYAEEFGRRYGT
jgi:hypothetical protein